MINTSTDMQDVINIIKTINEMTRTEKDILENAILEIYSMFQLDPKDYQLGIRFYRR